MQTLHDLMSYMKTAFKVTRTRRKVIVKDILSIFAAEATTLIGSSPTGLFGVAVYPFLSSSLLSDEVDTSSDYVVTKLVGDIEIFALVLVVAKEVMAPLVVELILVVEFPSSAGLNSLKTLRWNFLV